ncbi:MAG: putative tigger transposable element-derived protein 4 [Streblomastix strix]|uniref:Putative tigger transposable element-derived protein 4 n=1 Tax=Streblomastix strix TaxID=222440 RepID=A0A5J4UXS3_9EUKA|nr:MAG: putative tigger transposable element-derived protein 4 [Streblomastix strix]
MDNYEDKRIAEYYAGFIYRWKGRHAFNNIPIHGESGSADQVSALRWIDEALPAILKKFKPEDIFNMDEFALFFQWAMRNTIKEKGQEIKGTKISKKRINGLTGASITGEKLPLAIIGLSEHPRSFTGHKVQPFQYYSQKNAWMITPIFNEYLRRENEILTITGRKICITVDNCSSHKIYPSFFSNITIRYLTPNTTSVLQPMDQGIINVR